MYLQCLVFPPLSDYPIIYLNRAVLRKNLRYCPKSPQNWYWKTFYSTESGRQATVSYFLDNKDDGARMVVISANTDLWSDIKGDVEAFTLANWARWEVEKPDWFTEGFKAGVTDDYMPKGALDELNRKSVGGKRRRSSIGLLMMEGARTLTSATSVRNGESDSAASTLVRGSASIVS